MLFNKKFDFIMSVGEDCACSSYLRRFRLQSYSYPFDWLTNASFQSRFSMLCSDFQGFLKKENLKLLVKQNRENDDSHDYYEDTQYGFYFYHDFKVGIPFDESFEYVKNKYNRRIQRMYEIIEGSKSLLFVWWGRSCQQDREAIEKVYNNLVEKFGTNKQTNKQIYLLLVENSDVVEDISLCNEHVLVCRYDSLSYTDSETMGNFENNKKLFRKIKRKMGLKDIFISFMYNLTKFPIEILPVSKDLRGKLKKSLREYYFREKL